MKYAETVFYICRGIWYDSLVKAFPAARREEPHMESNLQDKFLNLARTSETQLTLFTTNGFQLRGVCRGFDRFTVVLDSTDGRQQLVYKHAISTIIPARPLSLTEE